MPDLDRSLSPELCLAPTRFIDSASPAITAKVRALGVLSLDPRARAAALFRFVRDEIRYEFLAKMTPEEYVGTHVLDAGRGFCVQKAVLLCALGRAAGLPAALVLSDLRDRSLSPRIVAALGTDVMYHHGLNAFHLDREWLLADASLSPDVVSRKRYRPVDFDGTRDAVQAPTTIEGKPHAEYVRLHGIYAELPFDPMIAAFSAAYANADVAALGAVGFRL